VNTVIKAAEAVVANPNDPEGADILLEPGEDGERGVKEFFDFFRREYGRL